MLLHEKFLNHIKINKVSVAKAAVSLNISRDHLYKMLRGERPIIDSNRIKLNAYLNTDFKEPDTTSSTSNDSQTPLI